MRCSSCDQQNPAGTKFCGHCGRPFAASCSRCGFENPRGVRFCGECGTSLQPAHGDDSRPIRELRSYTPRHIADRIRSSSSAIEGERKQVTVLFVDVKGSVELSETVDPEEWHRIMERFYAILSEGVHRFEGTINQFTGDGIMALFGAPLAHEDHARRACYAGLHMTEQLRGYSNELRLGQGLHFSVRMGLNSGEVIVGKIGDDLRMDYTALGATVGLASRMEQLAESGRVYLTENTAKLVKGYFDLERLGAFPIKGAPEPIEVYALRGLGPIQTRFDQSRARGFSKFVGRVDEMAQLESALAQITDGRGQLVGIVAEAGTGKSRLCYEFTERCRSRDIPVQKTHGVAHGRQIPFLPLFELLRGFFEISDRDSAQAQRNKIAGALLMLESGFEEVLPQVFEFLGVPDPERPSAPLAPETRADQLSRVVRRLIEAGAERQPQVILFEDLHWIDSGTESFLESVVEAAATTRTLLIVNFRPGYHARWMSRSDYRQIPLLPLGPTAVRELLQDLLGDDSSLEGLVHEIHTRTAGNPFFVEEVVQSLIESGVLAGQRGAYRLLEPLRGISIPGSIQTVLAARIDRLADREKSLLQTASVIGRRVRKRILAQVAGLDEDELSGSLHELVSLEFLNQKALFPEARYTFKHPLTREVAYGSQLAGKRRTTHASVARAIEELGPNQLDENAGLIAYHWEQAEHALQAAKWYRRAAEWTGMGHADESMAHWRKVRELAGRAPGSAESDGLGARARAMMLFISARIGAPQEDMERLYEEAGSLARRSHNEALLAQIESSYWFYHYSSSGRVEESIGPLDAAVELADRTDHAGFKMLSRMNLYFCCGFGGRIERGLVVNAQCLELSSGDPTVGAKLFGYVPRSAFVFGRIWLLTWAGRLKECDPLLQSLFEYARNEGDWVATQTAHVSASLVSCTLGDAESAVRHARRAVALTEALGNNGILYIFNRHILARALLLAEAWDEARDVLTRTIRDLIDRGVYRQIEGGCLAGLARAASGLGDLEEARRTVEEAVETASRNGWGFECDAQLARAHVLGRLSGRDAAEEIASSLRRAEQLIELSGARSRLPLLSDERAELASLIGDARSREGHRAEARKLREEIGARQSHPPDRVTSGCNR